MEGFFPSEGCCLVMVEMCFGAEKLNYWRGIWWSDQKRNEAISNIKVSVGEKGRERDCIFESKVQAHS